MEPLPDFATLSDEDLKKLIDYLTVEGQEVSYRRRLLHGKIDILRAELVARLQGTEGQDGPDGNEDGTREPRRPRPTAPSAAATADQPAEVDDQP